MTSEILDGLAAQEGCAIVRKADLDAFLARNPRALVFLAGDTRQRPEGLDVAVVVRELLAKFQGRLAVGLVDQRDEAAIMPKFGVVVLPAVVYVRDGEAAELVARMRDWPVFLQAAERLLAPAGAPDSTSVGGHA
jgi:hydrogenase-1 operon protein HyaE